MLSQHQEEFDRQNVQVVAIAADQTQKLRQFKQENQLTMTLIGDMRRISLKAFKVFTWGRIKDAVYRKFAIAIPSSILNRYKRNNRLELCRIPRGLTFLRFNLSSHC